MSDIIFDCIHCGHGLVVNAQAGGGVVNCPECSSQIVIPRAQPGTAASVLEQVKNLQDELVSAIEHLGETEAHFRDLERRFPEQRDRMDLFVSDIDQLNERLSNVRSMPFTPGPSSSPGNALPSVKTPPLSKKKSAWGLLLSSALIFAVAGAVFLLQPPGAGSGSVEIEVLEDLRVEMEGGQQELKDNASLVRITSRGLPAKGKEIVSIRFEVENLTKSRVRRIQHLADQLDVRDQSGKSINVRVETDGATEQLEPGTRCGLNLWVLKSDRARLHTIRWFPGIWKPMDGGEWEPLFDQAFLVQL